MLLRLRTFGGLWIEGPEADPALAPRPRSLALLALCAAAGPKGVSRERALGVLWPDSHPERARHALSQALYTVRREVGADVIVSSPDLRLDPQLISSDLDDFRAAIRSRNWVDAAALYAGPFLDAFYVSGAPEFERWLEEERSSLAADATRAFEAAADSFAQSGCHDEATDALRRLTKLDPPNSRLAAKYMEALAARGDRAGAVAYGRAHLELLQREFDLDPDVGLEQLVARLRESPPPLNRPAVQERPASGPATPVPASLAVPSSISDHPAPKQSPSRLVRRLVGTGVAALVVIAAIAVIIRQPTTLAGRIVRPVLAVGRLRDLAAPDSLASARVSSEMLATSLARVGELRVIASSRMLELTPRNADTSSTALTAAARRAGATEIVEGEFITLPNRQIQLDTRRVDVARGLVRAAYRVSGPDRVALLDSVTTLIAADLGVRAPHGSLTQVSTRSPIAFRLYEEGLRAFFQFDPDAARRLFRAALHEDSTFAMAAYYAWRTALTTNDPEDVIFAERALALAPTAPPRDRLLILTHVGSRGWDARTLASAETLAARYPHDPEALIRAGEVVPDLSRAVRLLNESITLDSTAGAGAAAICRLCESLALLTLRYAWADSDAAVRRTLDRWRAIRPNDAAPWLKLADWSLGFGRRAESDSATVRAVALGGREDVSSEARLVRAIRLDDFNAIDAECGNGLASDDPTQFLRFRWYCTMGLRSEGRYRDALALVHEGRRPHSDFTHRDAPADPYLPAILDLEMGRPIIAADQFLTLARTAEGGNQNPRLVTWFLTLAATAFVAGSDTLAAHRLVDSIEVTGSRSLFRRDPLLHHFVRGLLYARAQQQDAAVREFRAAMDSPTFGYTRINYELAKVLLDLHRPREAIPAVQGALHGGIEGSGLYVTRTELHELLARLFDADGQRDSAAAHYGIVARAWASADPSLSQRGDAAARWLATNRASRNR